MSGSFQFIQQSEIEATSIEAASEWVDATVPGTEPEATAFEPEPILTIPEVCTPRHRQLLDIVFNGYCRSPKMGMERLIGQTKKAVFPPLRACLAPRGPPRPLKRRRRPLLRALLLRAAGKRTARMEMRMLLGMRTTMALRRRRGVRVVVVREGRGVSVVGAAREVHIEVVSVVDTGVAEVVIVVADRASVVDVNGVEMVSVQETVMAMASVEMASVIEKAGVVGAAVAMDVEEAAKVVVDEVERGAVGGGIAVGVSVGVGGATEVVSCFVRYDF